MLEYALLKGSCTLVYIDDVPNGLKCGCVCPGCGDVLVAKNQCTDKSNHFSHHTQEEHRSCLMTQLHLVAQHYFLSAKTVKLPAVSLYYKKQNLTRGEVEVNITNASLEAKVDKFYADIILETDIGEVVIEILVTHKTENEKAQYYRDQKIAAIEYDLSAYKSLELEPCIDALKNNRVKYKWLYEWCRLSLIDEHEKRLKEEHRLLQKKRLRSAKDSARKFIKGKYILLPSIKKKIAHEINGKKFSEEVFLFTKKEQAVDSLIIVDETSEYLLLRGELQHHHIWVVFLLIDAVPNSLRELEGSVVIRNPAPDVAQKATWEWLRHPDNKKKYHYEVEEFKKRCQLKIDAENGTKKAEESAILESEIYVLSKDELFNAHYKHWSQWMIQNRLFEPTINQKHPKLPSILKYKRSYPCLWPFNSWHILTLSYLAEIIDKQPINIPIKYLDVFYELAQKTGIKHEFYDLERLVHPTLVKGEYKSLILRRSIVESAIEPFLFDMKIDTKQGYFVRKANLRDSLRV